MSIIANQPLLHSPSKNDIMLPILPTAYWISQGIDQATAYGIERFQCQLVDRKFTYAHVIYLEPATPNIQSIPHHDILSYHWKRYMMNLVQRGRAKSFFIDKFELRQSVLNVIVPNLLHMEQLGELGLCGCNIDRNGLLLVSKFVSRNQTLKRLLLNDNQIEDLDVAQSLSLAVKHHPSMEELCISHCGLGNNADVLPEILAGCNHLKILRLNGNSIGSDGTKYISRFLACNTPLTCLRLDKNLLSDVDAVPIAESLKNNSNLHYLYLKGNSFSEMGKKEMMMTAILDTTSLNSISDSNHECEIVFSTPILTGHINEKYWSIERKVQNKILLALYGMGNDERAIEYFRDVPLELIPHGLELIQKELNVPELHGDISYAVSRLFCFLRVWNLPWLFTNGCGSKWDNATDVVMDIEDRMEIS